MKKKNRIYLFSITFLLSIGLIACGSNNNSKGSNTPPSGNVPPSSDTSSVVYDAPVEGVSLNYETLNIKKGRSATLTATVSPYNARNKNVSWLCDNSAVAEVNQNGTISAIGVGSTTIIVTTEEGNFTASCVVNVSEDSGDTYVPPSGDTSIYQITNDTLSNGTYDSSKDEYTFAVTGSYKQIYVNAPDKTIIVELNGVTLENQENSPIYVADCDSIEISAKKDTVNNVKDTRSAYTQEEADQGKGAIYVSNGDLKLKGSGTLNVTANYFNGIHGKDDVKIQKQTLNITALNHGIKGNDSVTITSGTINVSCGGDGIKTENSDISSKNNQRGNVTISGGSVTINSWGDAISASYNAIVEETDSTVPTTLVANTNKYSSYSGDVVTTSTSSFYLKMNNTTYSNGNYTYAAYINGEFYKATYKGTQSSGGMGGGGRPQPGGSSTYHIYEITKPSSATSFILYRYQGSNVNTFSTETYNAVSDAKAFNTAYDMVQISVSSNKISFSSWSNYSSGNSNSADISAKGIKAENEIYIKGGTINIKAYDDGIHANNDGIIENGNTPLGNVNIQGGTTIIEASDDGIHADYTLNISGGTTTVTKAYEGLEGNIINVSDGNTYVYATDDGVNATKGKVTASITVSGGLLDVEVPASGDTDGIDSNGSFTLSGGTVITKGPGSASGSGGGGAFALDTDGTVSLTSGTLIVFGGIERSPSTSLTRTLCSSSSVSTGSHTVSFSNATSYTTTLKSSTSGCVVYSSLGSATLR